MAVLNLLLLYVLLRWCSRLLFRHSRHRILEISVALGATAIYVVYVLLEPVADINGTAIASLFLLVSYYPGVIISGLTSVALVLWTTRSLHRSSRAPATDPGLRDAVRPARRTHRRIEPPVLDAGPRTVRGHPAHRLRMRRLSSAWFWTLAGTIAVTVATGYVFRRFLERYTSLGVDSYIDWTLAGESFLLLRQWWTTSWRPPRGS